MKSLAFGPVMAIPLIVTALVPVLESVIVCDGLAVPTLWGAKVSAMDEIWSMGAIAVPASAMG